MRYIFVVFVEVISALFFTHLLRHPFLRSSSGTNVSITTQNRSSKQRCTVRYLQYADCCCKPSSFDVRCFFASFVVKKWDDFFCALFYLLIDGSLASSRSFILFCVSSRSDRTCKYKQSFIIIFHISRANSLELVFVLSSSSSNRIHTSITTCIQSRNPSSSYHIIVHCVHNKMVIHKIKKKLYVCMSLCKCCQSFILDMLRTVFWNSLSSRSNNNNNNKHHYISRHVTQGRRTPNCHQKNSSKLSIFNCFAPDTTQPAYALLVCRQKYVCSEYKLTTVFYIFGGGN